MANTFIALDDTEIAYTGKGGSFLRVNGAEDAVIFANASINALVDVITEAPHVPLEGEVLTWYVPQDNNIEPYWRPEANDPYNPGNGINISGGTINITTPVEGGLIANTNGIYIQDIANVAGIYGNTNTIPQITVNTKGQIVSVTEIDANLDISDQFVGSIVGTSGQITVSGGTGANAQAVVNLVATGVTSGVYGNTTHIPAITVDTYGRIQNVDMIEAAGGNIITGNGNIDLSQITTQAYKTIGVSGQASVSADRPDDLLIFEAGSGITITTNPGADTITFAADYSTLSDVSVGALANITLTGINNNDALLWNAATGELEPGVASVAMADLTDVDLVGITNQQVLAWDTANAEFSPISVVINELDDIQNVDTSGKIDGEVLTWDAANATFITSDVSVDTLNDIDDVVITNPQNGESLVWNSGDAAWENVLIAGGGGGNVSLTSFSVTTNPQAGIGSLSYNNAGVFTFTPAASQTLGLTGNVLSISLGNTVDFTDALADAVANANVSLPPTAVTPGTYGSNTTVAQFTVNDEGRITSASNVIINGAGGGGGSTVERFKLNYASNGDLASITDTTSGISAAIIESTTGGQVRITFDSGVYNLPPASVIFYGYDYTNNKYWANPLDASVGLREVAAGGVSGAPTLFDGASTVELRLQLREGETGATRGTFGTTTHAWIQFIL